MGPGASVAVGDRTGVLGQVTTGCLLGKDSVGTRRPIAKLPSGQDREVAASRPHFHRWGFLVPGRSCPSVPLPTTACIPVLFLLPAPNPTLVLDAGWTQNACALCITLVQYSPLAAPGLQYSLLVTGRDTAAASDCQSGPSVFCWPILLPPWSSTRSPGPWSPGSQPLWKSQSLERDS